MGLNSTPSSESLHIGFFGCRNAGKSSLVNAVTGQDLSVVSEIKGTTTDAVKKKMELLPLGPVVIIDTPGYDDEGGLGEKRIAATNKILRSCDIAVLVCVAGRELNESEKGLISAFQQRDVPYLIVKNKADTIDLTNISDNEIIYTSALKGTGIDELKNALGKCVKSGSKKVSYVGDLVSAGDIAVLVTPIDASAPKGRLILPQQQAIRELLDVSAIAVVTKENTLADTLGSISKPPEIVITDSQVFKYVNAIVPNEIPLTSFSILMARYKGFLDTAVKGVKTLDNLKDGAKILISEGCTHHRQCEDIGTVKLPQWIKNYTKASLTFEWSSGNGFPDRLDDYSMVIHCGGCMLNDNEMKFRMQTAVEQGIPFTNYGTTIAYMQGILDRSLAPLPSY